MPAQGRGANLDTSRRVGAPRGEGPSVRQQAASKAVPSYKPPEGGDRGPEKTWEQNRAFGPKPNARQGQNENWRPLRTPGFHPTSKGEGKVWVGKEVVRPAVKYGGTEAPRVLPPQRPNRVRTGDYSRRPGETAA